MPILYKTSKATTSGASDAADYLFFCPGCQCGHGVWTSHPNGVTGATWTFNGDMERPTFNPSIKVTTEKGVCHSFVRNGEIEFCTDSTHALAGRTVPLPDF